LNKYIKRYDDWCILPLRYNFNRTFYLLSIIYFISTLFDFCLTYITFTFDSDGFFMYEISFVIKRGFDGDPFFCMLIVILFMSPLIIVYGFNVYYMRRYNHSINSVRILLFALYAISGMHIVGGFTNFFYLISLEV